MRAGVVSQQVIIGLGPVILCVGELLVIDDDEQVIVGDVAADGIIDPVAPRVRAKQGDLEDASLPLERLGTQLDRVFKLLEQDLLDQRQLRALGIRQMIKSVAQQLKRVI